MSLLEVNNIDKRYGDKQVLRGVSFALDEGEIGCLLGPSGCGKTTLLRSVAGFEDIRSGTIDIAGSRVASRGVSIAPEHRGIGMVFQDYALFPHLSVIENVAFGLGRNGVSKNEARIKKLLHVVGLKEHAHAYPHELSGGQQQRAALARALAPRPKLLLLDEPFSNLDVTLRERLSMEVREIIKRAGATALMVTHNQHEAFAVADKVGVLCNGVMQQWDEPYSIYHHPANSAVACFVGEGVLVPGRVVEGGRVMCGLGELSSRFRALRGNNGCVSVLVRPEAVRYEDDSPVTAKIVGMTFRGASILYSLQLDSGDKVLAEVSSRCNHVVGQSIGIRADVEKLVLFPAEGLPGQASGCRQEHG